MRSKPTSLRERNAIGSRTLVVSFMLLSFAMSALILRQAHETFAGRPLESISGQSARTKKKTVWSATSSGGPPTREGGNDDDYEDDNESEADDNIIVDEEEDYEKDGPWVAPLLCYPNSGSSYTLVNTLALTNRTTATVHSMPKPTVAVRPDYAIPFLAKPHMKNPGLVLTKYVMQNLLPSGSPSACVSSLTNVASVPCPEELIAAGTASTVLPRLLPESSTGHVVRGSGMSMGLKSSKSSST
jgi:hypothetical protein